MSPGVEAIYYSLPVFMQNMLVSAYGFRLYRQRYGRQSGAQRRAIGQYDRLDAAGVGRLQQKLLGDMLGHAFRTVPYYRDYARRHGVSAGDFTTPGGLAGLPVLTKDRVRTDPERFCSDEYLGRRDSFWLSTSGTSGKPLNVLCDPASRRLHYAFWDCFRAGCGLDGRHTRATFFGRVIMRPDDGPPFWRYDAFGRNYLFSSYHLSAGNLAQYYRKLASLNPAELIGYPSSLYPLARYCLDNGLQGIRPVAVITTAETLQPAHREALAAAFDCPVHDQYGCTEMALFVFQCRHGTHHVHPGHGLLEVVDSEGRAVEPGRPGRAVCTGFVNRAMPLIRYELGDTVVMGGTPCACGLHYPVIREIVGRVDDILVTPDGRPLGRLDPVFKGMSHIRETQIIQNTSDSLDVRMVVGSQFGEDDLATFRRELQKRVGGEMTLNIEFVEGIPKDANGKFRAVISNL